MNTATPTIELHRRPSIDDPREAAFSMCEHCGERIAIRDLTADWRHVSSNQVTCDGHRAVVDHWNRQFEDS